MFQKNSQKLQKNNCAGVLFDEAARILQIFYKRLLEQLSMVFDPVQKSSENIHISLKTYSEHQVI